MTQSTQSCEVCLYGKFQRTRAGRAKGPGTCTCPVTLPTLLPGCVYLEMRRHVIRPKDGKLCRCFSLMYIVHRMDK